MKTTTPLYIFAAIEILSACYISSRTAPDVTNSTAVGEDVNGWIGALISAEE